MEHVSSIYFSYLVKHLDVKKKVPGHVGMCWQFALYKIKKLLFACTNQRNWRDPGWTSRTYTLCIRYDVSSFDLKTFSKAAVSFFYLIPCTAFKIKILSTFCCDDFRFGDNLFKEIENLIVSNVFHCHLRSYLP